MTKGVTKLGKQRLALGLEWQMIDAKGGSKAALQTARQWETSGVSEDDAAGEIDMYCLRPASREKPSVAQVGLGRKASGHAAGVPSAAAMLVSALPSGSFVGCWQLPEGWWVVVVREDLIEDDGDQLYQKEEDAKARLDIEKGSVARVYAPPEWRIGSADDSHLSLLLSDVKRVGVLQPIRADVGRKIRLVGLLVVLLGLVWFGKGYYDRYQAEAAKHKRAIPADALTKVVAPPPPAATTVAPPPPPPPPPVRVWEIKPRPSQIIEACLAAMRNVPAGSAGFALSDFDCGENGLSVRWHRTDGRGAIPAGAMIDAQNQTASMAVGLASFQARGAEQLLGRQAVAGYLLARPVTATVSALPDERLPVKDGAPAVPPPPWQRQSLRISWPYSPAQLEAFLDGLPGVVLGPMKRQAGGAWDIEATIYEARE